MRHQTVFLFFWFSECSRALGRRLIWDLICGSSWCRVLSKQGSDASLRFLWEGWGGVLFSTWVQCVSASDLSHLDSGRGDSGALFLTSRVSRGLGLLGSEGVQVAGF